LQDEERVEEDSVSSPIGTGPADDFEPLFLPNSSNDSNDDDEVEVKIEEEAEESSNDRAVAELCFDAGHSGSNDVSEDVSETRNRSNSLSHSDVVEEMERDEEERVAYDIQQCEDFLQNESTPQEESSGPDCVDWANDEANKKRYLDKIRVFEVRILPLEVTVLTSEYTDGRMEAARCLAISKLALSV